MIVTTLQYVFNWNLRWCFDFRFRAFEFRFFDQLDFSRPSKLNILLCIILVIRLTFESLQDGESYTSPRLLIITLRYNSHSFKICLYDHRMLHNDLLVIIVARWYVIKKCQKIEESRVKKLENPFSWKKESFIALFEKTFFHSWSLRNQAPQDVNIHVRPTNKVPMIKQIFNTLLWRKFFLVFWPYLWKLNCFTGLAKLH